MVHGLCVVDSDGFSVMREPMTPWGTEERILAAPDSNRGTNAGRDITSTRPWVGPLRGPVGMR